MFPEVLHVHHFSQLLQISDLFLLNLVLNLEELRISHRLREEPRSDINSSHPGTKTLFYPENFESGSCFFRRYSSQFVLFSRYHEVIWH